MADKKNFEIVTPEPKPLPQEDIEDIFEEDDTEPTEEFVDVDDEEEDSDEAEETDGEDEDSEDFADSEDAESESEPEPKPSAKKPVSKEQRKIIESKKTIQSLKQRLAALEEEKNRATADAKVRDKAKSYVDAGYNEDEARKLAAKDIQTEDILERLELAEFRSVNAFTLAKYPMADTKKVMATMRASGADIDVVCRLLYGTTNKNDSERRILEATEKRAKAIAAAPTGAKKANPAKTLTKEQQADKRVVEKFLRTTLTVDEYLKNHA